VTPPAATASKAEPQAEPKAAPKPAEQRVAALPPKDSAASQPAPAGVTRLSFGFNQAEMDQAAREGLQTIAKRLQDNESLRVQLLAYAGGEGMSSSQARRLSLSRALAVRSYLIEQGIRSTRMDVRALGNTGKDGPADRVDIRIIDR
jgi:outer membrane protein OmpA-like peptidoglycan-associated protein